jgi:hypothetical protein
VQSLPHDAFVVALGDVDHFAVGTLRSVVTLEPLREFPCGLEDLGAKRFAVIAPDLAGL